MHIVIMGCGRVGSTLAHILEDQGHSVAVEANRLNDQVLVRYYEKEFDAINR